MNYLKETGKLNNQYYALRHGHSEANREGIILSNPHDGVAGYGLTEVGIQQVKNSILKALQENNPDLAPDKVIIVSSDFKRARETAETAHQIIRPLREIIRTPKLRERFFGDLDKTSNKGYERVWALDANDSSHTQWNVESVDNTLSRSTALVQELDRAYVKRTFILTSHGDTLQILQTGFAKIDPRKHRSVTHLETAELRKLILQ